MREGKSRGGRVEGIVKIPLKSPDPVPSYFQTSRRPWSGAKLKPSEVRCVVSSSLQ